MSQLDEFLRRRLIDEGRRYAQNRADRDRWTMVLYVGKAVYVRPLGDPEPDELITLVETFTPEAL